MGTFACCVGLWPEHDWVSSDLLGERLGSQTEEPISELDFIDFQGHKFTATRKVLLRWHSLKMKNTRQGWFRVMEKGPFDILIGSKLLFSEGIYIFNETALLFYHRPPSASKYSSTIVKVFKSNISLDEESRMQQTLLDQRLEIKKHLAQRSLEQCILHQQQRAQLESNRLPSAPSSPTDQEREPIKNGGSSYPFNSANGQAPQRLPMVRAASAPREH